MNIALSFIPVVIIGSCLFFWVAMLVHAVRNNIPNKALWVLVLLLGAVIIGATVYYFAVYKDHNKTKSKNRWITFSLVGLFILFGLIIFAAAKPQPTKLKEEPLSRILEQANDGEIKRIEIKGNELKITKQGDMQPSILSRKESGSSLYEQGLTNKNVEIVVRPQ